MLEHYGKTSGNSGRHSSWLAGTRWKLSSSCDSSPCPLHPCPHPCPCLRTLTCDVVARREGKDGLIVTLVSPVDVDVSLAHVGVVEGGWPGVGVHNVPVYGGGVSAGTQAWHTRPAHKKQGTERSTLRHTLEGQQGKEEGYSRVSIQPFRLEVPRGHYRAAAAVASRGAGLSKEEEEERL